MALRELIAGMPRMRAMVRALRALPDRLLHPRRRRRAQATLARLGPVRRIVVLCLANINRSPFAAALLRARFVWAGSSRRRSYPRGSSVQDGRARREPLHSRQLVAWT